jgi:putative aldouronate transport system permease protein
MRHAQSATSQCPDAAAALLRSAPTRELRGRERRKLLERLKTRKGMLVMLAIGLLWYLVFDYYPMLKVTWAFTNIGMVPLDQVRFVGFGNFARLLGTTQFLRSFFNTIYISVLQLVFGFPIPIILALLLNEMRITPIKRTIQTIIYLPHFLSWVVVGAVWYIILSPMESPNAQIAALIGQKPIYWWADERYIRGLLVFTDIWRGAGFGTVVYLATLSGIDLYLYEAATIDGAGRWKQTWHITLPGIRSVIVILLILALGRILDIFQQVFVLTTPVVREPSDVLMTYAYRVGIQKLQFGAAMAVSVLRAVFGLVLVTSTNAFARKVSDGELGIF